MNNSKTVNFLEMISDKSLTLIIAPISPPKNVIMLIVLSALSLIATHFMIDIDLKNQLPTQKMVIIMTRALWQPFSMEETYQLCPYSAFFG
jgi:hypothetical protein